MVKLENGFKLRQPWVSDVVQGKLKYLVRSISTKKRERVAVIVAKRIDGIWIENAKTKEIEEIKNKVGAIGSVEIKDCITVMTENVKDELIKLAGSKYWDYYPKYLIPNEKKIKKVHIWILDKAKEWNKPKPVKVGGINWYKIELEDR